MSIPFDLIHPKVRSKGIQLDALLQRQGHKQQTAKKLCKLQCSPTALMCDRTSLKSRTLFMLNLPQHFISRSKMTTNFVSIVHVPWTHNVIKGEAFAMLFHRTFNSIKLTKKKWIDGEPMCDYANITEFIMQIVQVQYYAVDFSTPSLSCSLKFSDIFQWAFREFSTLILFYA